MTVNAKGAVRYEIMSTNMYLYKTRVLRNVLYVVNLAVLVNIYGLVVHASVELCGMKDTIGMVVYVKNVVKKGKKDIILYL